MRHKNKFQVNLKRKLKSVPFGSLRTHNSYAGECIIKNDDGYLELRCGGLINKRKARNISKDIIKQGIIEYDDVYKCIL